MLQIKWLNSLAGISAAHWDALFDWQDNPFCLYAFLYALEQGGSVDAGERVNITGWYSQHLTVWQDDTLIGAVPGYIKTHSYGEYLFDWQIVEAYRQLQLPYYPKWLAAIPFTPVSGPRLGVLDASLSNSVLAMITTQLKQHIADGRFASVQWLYTQQPLHNKLTEHGFLPRHDVQFLWHNPGYHSFDDYLNRLSSRKRKQIRNERLNDGVTLKTFHGHELTPQHWQAIIRCYQATYLKRANHSGYITEESFLLLAQSMIDQIVVFAAVADMTETDKPQNIIAAALCYKSKDTLYGRYWGTLTDADCLHFELCYYQGIEYCIQHQLRYFDAGAQGEHKLKRGFEPIIRYGSYLFADTPLSSAITHYFQQESAHLNQYKAQAMSALPYKHDLVSG